MKALAYLRINYKSDFILTLNSDAGWMTPFCIKFWTGAPSQAYFAGWDGDTYTHCTYDPSEPTKLVVQFDDHHLPIGDLKFQIAYHFTVADFPNDTEDEVINPANITTEIDGQEYQVMLDFTGETAPEIQFSLPAYANEAQRIANEQQRIANEQQRIQDEETRIAHEETRQENEAQRIAQETARVNEFATLKSQSQAATRDANDAATLANQKAEYAQQQGGYAKDQGDYAKNQGDYAKEQGDTALADHQRAEVDHTQAGNDHTRAESDHGIAVDDHTQAGTDHTRAESDHGIAVDDHTQAGSDHTRAESDHGIAVDDHTQAGTDHQTAQSDHTIAGNDHTQAGNDHTRAESDHTRAESDHAAVEVYVDSLGAFDISAYNATGGVLAKYADLTAALGTNGANIPDALRKGGMSVKFVLSSDNKYVQYFLTKDEWSASESDWEKMNLEEEVSQLGQKVGVIGPSVIDLFTPIETKTSGLTIGDSFLSGDSSDIVGYFPVKKGDGVVLTSQCATGMTNRWVIAGFCNSIPAVGVSVVDRYAVQLANDTIIDKKDFVAPDDGYFAIGYRYTTMTHMVNIERVSVVKYTEQALTDSQKEQARRNINAAGKDEVALQDCATYFGFTVSLIKKFSGIFNLNGDSDQTSDNLLNRFQSEDVQLELSDGIIEVQTSDNTELLWTNGVAYEDLVKYDYNTVFVKYNDNYPYYIECIGIAYDGVTFTEEEKVLLSKFFRLPLFRNGKMLMDGIVKGNRGLSVASHVNLVSSPRFGNPSDWTYGPAWTLSLGDASCNDEGNAYSLLQNVDMEVGSRYKVLFKVSNYQSGDIEFRVDYSLFVSSAITENGIYEIEFNYTSGGHPSHVKEIMFRPTVSGFVGSINYVELYKVS